MRIHNNGNFGFHQHSLDDPAILLFPNCVVAASSDPKRAHITDLRAWMKMTTWLELGD